ncbi:MAG TPA: dipeptidase [Candidatus Hydrogenedentes bacterium]|nr:dipeptidase [Candidatus Hydrogenedentota bacterium]
MNLDATIARLRSKHDRYVSELAEALRIPSIATLPEHAQDMQRMADWLARQMATMGLDNVAIMPTSRNPVVYGDWLRAPGKPTVLVYGHYDVQPADPLDEWHSPPFEPRIEDEYIYARGASDMKGQIFAQLKAVEAALAEDACPINLKYLIEGDEEIGSPSLEDFILANRELLQCDVVLNCDTGIHAPHRPSITYALRGLAYFEFEVTVPDHDLHSGSFGGSIRNPIHVVCDLIAGMHDGNGRIMLPGFYDAVRPLDDEERAQLREAPYSDADWLALTGAPALYGEAGFTTLERVGARPSLSVNGVWGGFQGEGAKTVLPARAGAKISLRLVPDQKPAEAARQLRAYLEQNAPPECHWELRTHSLGPGAVMSRKSPYMQAAVKALETVFGRKPFFRREGASVPVVGMIKELLDVDSIMLGFALPDDGIHGPNERQSLPVLFKGMEAYIHFLAALDTIERAG